MSSGRRHEMVLAEGWHNAGIAFETVDPSQFDSLEQWPSSFQGGLTGASSPAPCGGTTCAGTTQPEWDDAYREAMLAHEGGQGSAVDQAQVKVREVTRCVRVIRPKDMGDGSTSWPGDGGWSWTANAVSINSGIPSGTSLPEDKDPNDQTGVYASWCFGRPVVYESVRERTFSLEHAKVSGGATWNKRFIVDVGGTDYWYGIPQWEEFTAELTAREQARYATYGQGLYGLVLGGADLEVYHTDPNAGYYTSWTYDGGWFGGYPRVYHIQRTYPGRLHGSGFLSDGGFQTEWHFIRSDFEIPEYSLPPGMGIISSYSFSTTNADAKRHCMWWVQPRFDMTASPGTAMPDPLVSSWQYPAGDSDSIQLNVSHDVFTEHGNRSWGALRAKGVRERNASTITNNAVTYEWDGTSGDLPDMGTYSYSITAGKWPSEQSSGYGGTGPSDVTGRLRCGPGHELSATAGYQHWWPQVRPEKTGSPYEWPANIELDTVSFRAEQSAPRWQGVPDTGPEAFIASQYGTWIVDDCVIDGVDCEVCTSRPHLSMEYTVGNWP